MYVEKNLKSKKKNEWEIQINLSQTNMSVSLFFFFSFTDLDTPLVILHDPLAWLAILQLLKVYTVAW